MANIRMVSWNIQVYGAKKWGRSPNGDRLIALIAQLLAPYRPNLVVTMELMSSVAEGISFNLSEALQLAIGGSWTYEPLAARPNGDREAYCFHWRTDDGFQRVGGAELSPELFPNTFSVTHGRQAASMVFQTQDTGQLLTAMVYHAPANSFAVAGLAPIARTARLYTFGGAAVNGRLIAGDFNLDLNVQDEYHWLLDDVPNPAPPTRRGEGAGCRPAVTRDTHLITFEDAAARWPHGWSPIATAYRSPLAIDNIFSCPHPGASGIIDVLYTVATDNAIQRSIEGFDLQAGEAFPNAGFFPNLGVPVLAQMQFAFLFTRYAISDHLPVYTSIAI